MRAAVSSVRATGAEAVELLQRRNYVTRLHPRDQRCRLSFTNSIIGPLSIGRAVFDMVGDLRGDSPGTLGIARARAGRLSYARNGEELRWSKGDLFVSVDPVSEYVLHVENADVEHTMIDAAVFDQVAQPPPGQTLRLTGSAPVSPQAAACWLRTWAWVNEITTDSSRPVPNLVVGQAARLLAAVTLTSFPSNALLDPSVEDRYDAHPATVRRAVTYIETNPRADLTVVDIARAAAVTPRALQLAFRRHLDTTPMRYLRRVRLDLARTDLRRATAGDGTTVTDVARRWGFGDLSRFAADYRAAYGEHPHRTLRRVSA